MGADVSDNPSVRRDGRLGLPFAPAHDLDVYEVLASIGPVGSREVAAAVGSSYETAYHKLRTLEDEGRVESRKVANARLWTAVEPEGGE